MGDRAVGKRRGIPRPVPAGPVGHHPDGYLYGWVPGRGWRPPRRLRAQDSECALLFVTTSVEHGIASYELQASDYLVKPVAQRDLDAALDWCLQEKREYFRTINVRSEWDEIEILLRDILYIEIRRHTAFIHTAGRVVRPRAA